MCSTITIRKGWVRFSSLTLLWYFDLFGSLSNLYWSHMPHWWAIIHTDIYFHFKVGSFWAGVAIKAIRTLFPALLLCIVLYICIFFNFCKARFCDMETVRKEYFTDSTLPQDFLDWRSLLLHLVIIMMKGWVLMHSKEEIIARGIFRCLPASKPSSISLNLSRFFIITKPYLCYLRSDYSYHYALYFHEGKKVLSMWKTRSIPNSKWRNIPNYFIHLLKCSSEFLFHHGFKVSSS